MRKYVIIAICGIAVYVAFGALNAHVNDILLNAVLCFLSLVGAAAFILSFFIMIFVNIGQGDPDDQ